MKKLFLLLVAIVSVAMCASAQTRTIRGTVLSDADGEPLIGATVLPLPSGSASAVVTDADGHFSLRIPASVKEVKVSYVGYESVTLPVSQDMEVRLKASDSRLEEVVVTGYGTGRKLGSVVGSVAVVSEKAFENKPSTTFVDALQGQVAGLSILSSSGDPSAVPSSIRIRGVNSIDASNTPLFILDGAPTSSSIFTTLNPNDIESTTVLKDAAATAIYGSRAANGVIVITTKKGKLGQKGRVTVRANVGWSSLVEDQITMMNSKQYLEFRNKINQPIVDKGALDAINKYNISTNWRDEIFDNAALLYSIEGAASGGSDRVRYYISLQHYDQDGLIASSGMHRETLRSSIDAKVNDWFSAGIQTNLGFTGYETNGFNASGSYNNANNPVFGARKLMPYDSPYYYTVDEGGNIQWGEKADFYHYSGMWNPVTLMSYQPSNRSNLTATVNMYETINPIKGLTFKAQQAVTGYDYRNTAVRPDTHLSGTPMSPTDGVLDFSGRRSESFQRYYQFTYTNTAEYRFSLNDVHNITALVGQESIISKNNQFSIATEGQTDPRQMLLTNGTEVKMSGVGQSISESTMNSYFVNASYNYDERYFFDGSFRRDGSSKFAPKSRWSNFWSVGAMWNMKSEEFFKDYTWLDKLQLRASYGTAGNSGIDDYTYFGLIASGSIYNGNGSLGISQAPNYDLKWETVKGYDFGLAFGIFDHLTGEIDFYHKKTCDMLLDIPYSYTTGFSEGSGNIGSMTNTGIDIDLNAAIYKSKDWYVGVRANMNYNKNKVTELFNGKTSYPMPNYLTSYEIGKSVGQFYMVEYAGVDPTDGKQMWVDCNGNLTKTFNEERDAKVMNKSQYAPLSGGFGFDLRWKDLSLRTDFAWQGKKYLVNNDLMFIRNAANATSINQMVEMLNVWTKPGDITDIPGPGEEVQFDTRFLENASFLRMKNVTLQYSLPRSIMNKLDMAGIAFHFTGRNLLTFTNFTGYDPEPESNLVLFRYPNTRQYEFGVEVTF